MRGDCNRRKADMKRGIFHKSTLDQPRPTQSGRGDGAPSGGSPDTSWPSGRPNGGRGNGGGAAGALAFSARMTNAAADNQSQTWVIDSGATEHMTKSMKCYTHYTPTNGARDVTLADGQAIMTKGTGLASVVVSAGSSRRTISLKGTLHVPDLKGNLLSVRSVDRAGGASVFVDGHCFLLANKNQVDWSAVVDNADVVGGVNAVEQYVIEANSTVGRASVANQASTEVARLWHRGFFHMGIDNLKRVSTMVTGIPREVAHADRLVGSVCGPCAGGKMAHAPFPRSTTSTTVMELLHADICGPLETSLGGSRYFTTLLDDRSGLIFAIPIKEKGDAAEVLIPMIRKLERLSGRKTRRIRHDWGGEYRSRVLDDFNKAEGINAEYSAPYAPQQNGKAERANRTLKERVRAALLDAEGEPELWAEALAASVYVMNRSPKAGATMTPWEAFTGRRPNVSNLRVWGGRAWALNPPKDQRMLESRTAVGRFVGYTSRGNAYRVLLDGTDRVVERRDVLVEETAPVNLDTTLAGPGIPLDIEGEGQIEVSTASGGSQALATTPPTHSLLEHSSSSSCDTERDTENTGDSSADDPPTTAHPIAGRYPGRVRQPPGEWWRSASDYHAGVVTVVQCGAEQPTRAYSVPKDDNGEELRPPMSINEARERPDWPCWEEALKAEFGALQKLGAWQVVDLPAGT